jgi:hypothetical protein
MNYYCLVPTMKLTPLITLQMMLIFIYELPRDIYKKEEKKFTTQLTAEQFNYNNNNNDAWTLIHCTLE